ncbi:type IX secretion system membrane protein PorP/SprF [bacterium]|nr:type IX secretion system membrane protein PorP/SprF [bacterium]
MTMFKNRCIVIFLLMISFIGYGQQDPQFTMYQYNPLTVNAGYAGSRGHLTAISLYRSQWAGLEGSPETITFGIDTPLSISSGAGLNIIQDELGPSTETYIDANYAYQLILNRKGDKLALGLKAGARVFNLDFSKGIRRDQDDVQFNENVNSRLLPTVGAGLFYYTDKAYLGLSVPNFFASEHFDRQTEVRSLERTHFFLIGGYVFDVNPTLKFKPSFFVKQVVGAPIQVDVSGNFLLSETLNLGVNYRWDDSISALLGFKISPKFDLGYAFDYSTNGLNQFNSGTHEVFLRYQFVSRDKLLKSPRFF